MIIGAALLIGTLIMATQAHRPLQRLVRGNWDPRVVISCWLLALASVVLTSTIAVYLLSHNGHGTLETLLEELGRCWATIEHADTPTLEQAATITGAALLLYLGSRLVLAAAGQIRVRRRRGDNVAFLLAVAGDPGTGNIHWLDHPEPVAFSVAGRPGIVAASRGLADILTPAELRATLTHEQAHLNGHHHLLVDIAEAAAAALPWAPLFRAAPAAMRELVELAADDTAATHHGAPTVAHALQALTPAAPPTGGLAMADTAVTRRLARLADSTPRRLHNRRNLWCAAAALTIPLLPALLGAGLLLGIGCA